MLHPVRRHTAAGAFCQSDLQAGVVFLYNSSYHSMIRSQSLQGLQAAGTMASGHGRTSLLP